MALNELNLNTPPYNDDFDPLKQYYRVLFKPGVSVQTRELNTLQSIQQNQTEKFADNIFKSGTIVDGCNFIYHSNYPYIKIQDSLLDGNLSNPSLYVGKFVKNDNGLTAHIINFTDGFEISSPDLKTLYLSYIDSGNSGIQNSFSSGETVTIFDAEKSIPSISILSGGSGFSNTNEGVVVPSLIVRTTTGAFTNGDYISQPSTGANLEIISTTQLTTNHYLLKVKPRNSDLANSSVNAIAWTLNQFENVKNPANTVAGSIVKLIGSGLSFSIKTNGIGKIIDTTVTNQGKEFDELPYLTVRSINNLTGINALNLTPNDNYGKVKVSTLPNSIGSGYAFSVSAGTIYQKGFLLEVLPQTIIVSKYSSSPNNVVVGFSTKEELVSASSDDSLYDNAFGTPNFTAPGADRLKLIPELIVLDKQDSLSNSQFNSLVEWSGGQPFKQNKATQYSRIGDEAAKRTFDESGNFVVDTFQIATASVANAQLEGNTYTVVVDPGQAYISGYKTQTLRNFYIDVSKGIDTSVANNYVSLNYGNYIRLNQLGGIFQFSTADTIDFYNTAKTFASNTVLINSGNTNPVGTKIGSARMRSLVLENGTQGDASAVYRLYLFDIRINKGYNFNSIKSVYYNGSSYKGIADLVLTVNPTTGQNVAVLEGQKNDSLIFNAGVESLKNSNNTTYTYRTIDQTTSFANTGLLTKSIASIPNEFYPYSGNLSSSQLKDLYVVPVGNNLVQYINLTGTVSVNTTSNLISGTGTNFFNDFEVGDYVYLTPNATAFDTKRIMAIVNAAAVQLDSPVTFANTTCNFRRIFPKNIPIPFGTRTGLTANVDVNRNILTLKLNQSNGSALTLEGTVTVNTSIGVNIQRSNVISSPKAANRNKFVKIYCGNNNGNTVGPWSLGISDVFRLRNVYVGNSTVNTSSSKISSYFYVDHNQNSNFLDVGYLYKSPRRKLNLSSTDYLLVEFDYFTRSAEGYFDTVSYLGTANTQQIYELNSKPLANLTSTAASFEVPEVYNYKGDYFDLLNCLDFRPAAANTVVPGSSAATAPLNPSETLSFGNTSNPANDKKFPLPDSTCQTTISHYLGRVDSVYIAGSSGEIYVLKGIPNIDPRKRYDSNHPKETLKLQTITVPAYPNISDNNGFNVNEIINTGIFNERSSGIRLKSRKISPLLSSYEFQLSQPMVYTMEDIANLERRLKDLEYYQSLSILETSITNKIIPSSVNKSLNRFKFGFFADDFSTDIYSDLENPQYAASIETEGILPYGVSKSPLETEQNWGKADQVNPNNKLLSPSKLVQKATNRIVPPKFIWTMPHTIDNLMYIDEPIIIQSYATMDPPEPKCVPRIVDKIIPSSNGYFYVNKPSDQTFTSHKVIFGQKSGPVTLYFDNEGSFIEYKVFKNDSIVINSSLSANSVQQLSSNNISFIQTSSTETGFTPRTLNPYTRNGDFVNNSGKLTFNHDPSTGTTYIIEGKIKSGSGYQLLIEYPLTNPSTTSTIVNPCIIENTITKISSVPATPLGFTGTIFIPPGAGGNAWACSKQFAINSIMQTALAMRVTGLKPNTIHNFYVDGLNVTPSCEAVPQSKFMAAENSTTYWKYGTPKQLAFLQLQTYYVTQAGKIPLLSDPEGKLYFIFNAPLENQSWFTSLEGQNNPNSFGSSGYTTFMLKADNSIATKLVAKRTSKSNLPSTPAGFV